MPVLEQCTWERAKIIFFSELLQAQISCTEQNVPMRTENLLFNMFTFIFFPLWKPSSRWNILYLFLLPLHVQKTLNMTYSDNNNSANDKRSFD